ncbi:hypothetical protein MBLNU459_g4436t2 [Dothideomycetes sp. NU459]
MADHPLIVANFATSKYWLVSPDRPTSHVTDNVKMISVSITIGLGIFVLTGEMLRIAGPAGTIVAFGIVSVISIWVMNGIAEMIQLWPISNAFVEFVAAFVDRDLATVVGIAYWYAYSMAFQSLLVTAASLASRWDTPTVLQGTIFYFVCPLCLYGLNYMGVFWLGLVESVLGFVKLAFLVAMFVLLLVVNRKTDSSGHYIGTEYLSTGFQSNPDVTNGIIPAICAAIPIAAFAFVGVETIAVSAYEAKSREHLRMPVKYIAWIISFVYLLSAFGFVANVNWCDPLLPSLYDQKSSASVSCPSPSPAPKSRRSSDGFSTNTPSSQPLSPIVIALQENGYELGADIITGFLIFVVLSAANSGLYVASRALFGLTREIKADSSLPKRIVRRLGFVTRGKRVRFGKNREIVVFGQIPAPALFCSALIFCWIPFIHLSKGSGIATLQQVLSEMGTVGTLLMWAAQALAYIRFNSLRQKYRAVLRADTRYTQNKSWGQPLWAWLAFIGSLTIVFVLNTATWWNGYVDKTRAIATFLGPVILLIIWLCLKLYHGRWLDHEPDERQFTRIIGELDRRLIESELPPAHLVRQVDSETGLELKSGRVHTGLIGGASTPNTSRDDDDGPREWM